MPSDLIGNRVVMLVNTEADKQIALYDLSSGFSGCKVGSNVKVRGAKTPSGFIGYKFIPGSCSN